MTNVTIRQMRIIVQIAELGSFTRAAERLGLAQPALSQQVRDLEAELGIRLLDRTTRRVELTEAGREFCAAARKIVEDVDRTVRDARSLATRSRGRVVVAAPPLLAAVTLPAAIADFRSRYPGIEVTLVDVPPDRIPELVRAGEVHCGLGTLRSGEEGISVTPLVRDRLLLFCAHDHPLAARDSIRWRDLADWPLITLTRASGIRLLVEVGFETAETPLQVAYEVSQVTTALAMVEADLGISVLPTYAWAATRGHRLSTVALVEPVIQRDISLITHADRSISPSTSAFARSLSKHVVALLPSNDPGAGR